MIADPKQTSPRPVAEVAFDLRRAVDELWNALSDVMHSLVDSGADDGRLADAAARMRKAHEHLERAGI